MNKATEIKRRIENAAELIQEGYKELIEIHKEMSIIEEKIEED